MNEGGAAPESVAMAVAMQSKEVSKSLQQTASLEVRRETDRQNALKPSTLPKTIT